MMHTHPQPGPARRRAHRLLGGLLALSALAGCRTVDFYEKAAFSDPAMTMAESAAMGHWRQKVQYSDEGAAGGIGTAAGGGCGCY